MFGQDSGTLGSLGTWGYCYPKKQQMNVEERLRIYGSSGCRGWPSGPALAVVGDIPVTDQHPISMVKICKNAETNASPDYPLSGAGSRLPERVGCGECAFSLCQFPPSQRHLHRVFRGTLAKWNGKMDGRCFTWAKCRGMVLNVAEDSFLWWFQRRCNVNTAFSMLLSSCNVCEEILMSYIWTVTGWHRHVGTVGLSAASMAQLHPWRSPKAPGRPL